jgi:hypothetical protein
MLVWIGRAFSYLCSPRCGAIAKRGQFGEGSAWVRKYSSTYNPVTKRSRGIVYRSSIFWVTGSMHVASLFIVRLLSTLVSFLWRNLICVVRHAGTLPCLRVVKKVSTIGSLIQIVHHKNLMEVH